jgi:tetratricopeptide (TPR) repeat protein
MINSSVSEIIILRRFPMVGLISIIGSDIFCEEVGGVSGATVRIPLTGATITQWQQWTAEYRQAVRTNDLPAIFALGKRIFAWLDEAQWATAWAMGTGPRLVEIAVNEVESPAARALLDLPWEIMAQEQDFLAGDPAQPFVVYRSIGKTRTGAPAQPAHRDLAALFMAASPTGQQELDYEAEEAAILQATEHLPMQLVVEESGCAAFCKERLAQDGPFEVVHLSCHGDLLRDGEPVLALETPEGELALTRPGDFATLLGEKKTMLVFLSACRTAESRHDGATTVTEPFVRALIRAGVANALGWDGSVYDTDAIAFARTFYGELANYATAPFAAAVARGMLLRSHRADNREGLHWHLARVYVGPTGAGACCDPTRPKRRLRRDAGFREFLDKANDRVPVATAQEFVGRRREAQQILRAFYSKEAAGVLLFGMGNLGKSSLAARIANRLPKHQTVVVYERYDALAIFEQLVRALPGHARATWEQNWRQAILENGARLGDALEELLEGPFDAEPILLIIDDLEQILVAPQPDQMLTPVNDAPGSRDAWRTSLAAVLRAFAAADTPSRLLLTSRYRFTLPDGRGRDLADRLLSVQLRPMGEGERRKQWRAAAKMQEQAGERAAAEQLAHLALAVAGGNPGLQEVLCRPLLAGELDAAVAAIDAVEHWKQSGQLPPEENAAQEFFQRIVFATYENALTAAQRTQLRAATLFSEGLPAPWAALEAAGRALAVADPQGALARLLNLGLVDGWGLIDGVEHAAANPLARPLAGAPLNADEQTLLATATLPPLYQGWRNAGGDFPVDPRGVEAARLALLGKAEAALIEAAAYPAGRYHFYTEHDAKRALALLQAALAQIEAQGGAPRPHFLRLAADCAERIGERKLQLELLEKGLALTSPDRRAMAQLAATYAEATIARDGPDQALGRLRHAVAVFEELDDVRSRAVTMGQIADILQQRGETDEALRIRREDCLPVYERLNDVRSRAVTMGQIADILQQRGETDEALRIHLEERLPVAIQIQDMVLIAHIRFSCARIRMERDGLQTDERQTIVDELVESFALLRKVQRMDGIAVVGLLLGQVLAAVDLPTEALTVLDQAAAAFARLKQDAQVAQIRQLQARLQQTSDA